MKIETSELQRLFEAMEEENLFIGEVITLIQGKNKSIKTRGAEFNLSVDYSRTLQEMINAGNYACVNSDITDKNFPIPPEMTGKKVEVSAKLFHFNRPISSEDAISEMDKAGYRPATLAELLALGEAQPELQRQFPIIALGSVWHHAYGYRRVPCLDVGGVEREFNLGWFGRDWVAGCRFLAVRK